MSKMTATKKNHTNSGYTSPPKGYLKASIVWDDLIVRTSITSRQLRKLLWHGNKVKLAGGELVISK